MDYIEELGGKNNVHFVHSQVKNNFIWDNLVIPYYAYKYRCQIVFYPKSSACLFRLPGKKIVTTIHGMVYKKLPEAHQNWVNAYWRVIGKIASIVASKIIVVSQSDMQDLLSEGYQESKMVVIPIGINEGFSKHYDISITTEMLRRYGLSKSNYLVQLGHLTTKKNQRFSLDLFRELQQDFPSLKLVLIGSKSIEGNYTDDLQDYVLTHDLQSKVIFTDAVNQNLEPEVLPILLQNASLFLFPSLYEGFGMPPVEAIASGIPVITSDRGSLPEIVGRETVLDLDIELWKAKCKRLLQDKNFRDRFLETQQKVILPYQWSEIGQAYIGMFQDLTG